LVAWVGLACLILVLVLHMRVDTRIWGASITPGVLLTGGYTAVAAVYALASLVYRFNPIHAATYVFLSIAGLLQVGISYLVWNTANWQKSSDPLPRTAGSGPRLRFALLGISFAYGYIAYGIANAYGGLWSSESMGALGSGPVGHLNIILACIIVWYAVTNSDRKIIRFPVLAFALLTLSFNPVKGWTLIPMMGIVLAEISRRGSGSSKLGPLIIGAVAGVLVFVSIYLARAISQDTDTEALLSALSEIGMHFVFYATAGFFGLDAVIQGLELNGGLQVLFAPLVNLVNVFQGEQFVSVISNVYIIGIQDGGTGGNVFSIYGSLIGYGGWVIGSLLGLIIVAVAYRLRAVAYSSHSPGGMVASNYLSAILMFGWFDYYFFSLTPFEVFFFCAASVMARYVIPRGRNNGPDQ
jgi:Family of unknown function (DUF6337)